METVYIIGAGFSAGLGYPTTSNLLIEIWPRLSSTYQDRLGKVIAFHQPRFDSQRATSFPYIETLLTQISVNLEMFKSSRIAEGSFTKDDLVDVRTELLTQIALWFHSLYPAGAKIPWLAKVAARLRDEKATVISFNWDLVLDQKLFGEVSPSNYGLESAAGPRLLKPHGSLNWYEADQIEPVSAFARTEYLASALVDMKLHLSTDTAVDPRRFEITTLAELGMPRQIVMRHRIPHFGHIFSGEGYAAGYYDYLWAALLGHDALEAFIEVGDLFDPFVAARLKATILAVGNSIDPAEAFRNFRGRDFAAHQK